MPFFSVFTGVLTCDKIYGILVKNTKRGKIYERHYTGNKPA